MRQKLIILILFISILNSCKKDIVTNKIEVVSDKEIIDNSFIKPVLKNINIPYKKNRVKANKNSILKYKSGTKIEIPNEAFLDKEGNIVVGDVDVYFREFRDPLDFFLSGIPMEYNLNGDVYTFESDGMFEMKAFQNNKPVFVNPSKKPKISLKITKNTKEYKFYYLDTVQRKWVKRNKLENIKKPIQKTETIEDDVIDDLIIENLPTKPIMASGNKPTFDIHFPNIDFYPELKDFKNTIFEIDDSETNYNPDDANIEWNSFNINRSETVGVYIVEFKTTVKSVSYRVKPVYEEKDFKEALKTYEKVKAERLEAYEKKKAEKLKALKERQKENLRKGYVTEEILRTFQIGGFGIYNVDRLIKEKGKKVFIKLKGTNNDVLKTKKFAMIYSGINSIFNLKINEECKILENNSAMIWAIVDKKFAYTKFNPNLLMSSKTSDTLSFKLETIRKEIKSIEDIRKVINLTK